MDDICFTTTALSRPEIIEKTYSSFNSNIKGGLKKYNLIINIDPVPNSDENDKVVKISEKYFKNVIYRISETPNFTSALNWCWETANTEYIFHLEDDWILDKSINLEKLIKKNLDFNEIILRAYTYKYDKLALSPGILSKKTYKSFVHTLETSCSLVLFLRALFL